MGGILSIVGVVILLIGGIMMLIAAFRVSIVWGLASLFIPFAGLVFIFLHWSAAKTAFFLQLIGLALFLLGGYLSPNEAATSLLRLGEMLTA
jgi:hypothetical protein